MIPGGMLRISTNEKNRMVHAPSEPISPIPLLSISLLNGNTYIGEAVVVGEKCVTIYQPIKDNGNVIGAYFIGVKYSELFKPVYAYIDQLKKENYKYIYIINTKDISSNIVLHPTKKDSLSSEKFLLTMAEQKKRKTYLQMEMTIIKRTGLFRFRLR
jgi:hypothetical protein